MFSLESDPCFAVSATVLRVREKLKVLKAVVKCVAVLVVDVFRTRERASEVAFHNHTVFILPRRSANRFVTRLWFVEIDETRASATKTCRGMAAF